jgi:hypothetical protein
MGHKVSRLFGPGWHGVTVQEDYSGIPRVVVAQKI